MTLGYLDFEKPILALEQQIEEFRRMEAAEHSLDIQQEIEQLQTKAKQLTSRIFSDLSSWQVAQLARHPHRAYFLDYVERLFTEFEELHGDRNYADDPAIICGIARFHDRPVAVIGQQKGRDVKGKVYRNFGMPRPEGYRKALRIMSLAERFGMPILTFIDTPGAYPGVGAEERGQSEAIAKNLLVMSGLKVPIISTVIGEGGSGGALAIGVCDHLNMLQFSTYSVISPEGCASILWKSADFASNAAEAMGLTAERLSGLGLVDTVIAEPLGGVHRDFDLAASTLGTALSDQLTELDQWSKDELVANRQERILNLGRPQYSEKSVEKTKERRAKLLKKAVDRASDPDDVMNDETDPSHERR